MRFVVKACCLVGLFSTMSFSFFDGCMNERLSREVEFKLMYDCVRPSENSIRYASEEYEEKIKKCSCFIGAVICEEGEKAISKCDSWEECPVRHNAKKMKKCLEEISKNDR